MNDRPDYITGLQQCSNGHETRGPLTDGLCGGCLYPPPRLVPVVEYGITFYRHDGTYDRTQRFRNRQKAELAFKCWSAIDPRRVKFETFPPAGLLPAEFPRAVQPEPAVPEVTAGALLSAEDR